MKMNPRGRTGLTAGEPCLGATIVAQLLLALGSVAVTLDDATQREIDVVRIEHPMSYRPASRERVSPMTRDIG